MEKKQNKGTSLKLFLPETKTIVIGCGDAGLNEAVKKYIERKEGKSKTQVIVLKKASINKALDTQMRLEKVWKEKENIMDFVKNPANSARAFYHAKSIKMMVQEGQDIYFSLKDMVDKSNMTHKGAQDMLNVIHPFGLLAVRVIGKQKQYKILDSDKLRLQYLNQAKEELSKQHEIQLKSIDDLFEWVSGDGAIE